MAKNNEAKIDGKRWYTVPETVGWLRLTAETIKKKCREGEIEAKQVGTRKQWHIQGLEVIRLREAWNLAGIER